MKFFQMLLYRKKKPDGINWFKRENRSACVMHVHQVSECFMDQGGHADRLTLTTNYSAPFGILGTKSFGDMITEDTTVVHLSFAHSVNNTQTTQGIH
jgi:hypothetical protein